MALNYPGPYEVRISYSAQVGSEILLHEQRLNVALDADPLPGTPFLPINAVTAAAGLISLQTAVDAWVVLMAALHNATNSFLAAELWKYEPLSFESSFVSTHPLAVAGTGAGSTQAASQVIWTFRTLEGGVMKISNLETVIPINNSVAYIGQTASQQAVVDSILAGNNTWLGRDTSYPFAAMLMHPGSNEAVFKKRYRKL